MAPLVGLLIKALLPVAVAEVQKKLHEKDPQTFERPSDVPLSAAAVPAVQAVVAGTITSKTGWFALLLMFGGFLEQNQQLISSLVPADKMGWVIGGIGALSFLLRSVTTTSLTDKVSIPVSDKE